MSEVYAPLPSDLPPRTWRRWWLEWPKWFRVGCYGAIALAGINVLLAIWMAVGINEISEIRELRDRGVEVTYFWEETPERFENHHEIVAGLYWRTWSNIVEIQGDGKITDDDLRRIAASCGLLRKLSLNNSEALPETTGLLGRCRNLEELSLVKTDADDAAVLQFAGLNRLTTLNLRETVVSDAAIPVLKSLPKLKWIDVQYTDITSDAVADWRASRSDLPAIIATEKDQYPAAILGAIRWSDGRRSGNFERGYDVCVEGPLESHRTKTQRQTGWYLHRSILWWRDSRFTSRGDGKYRFTLRMNHRHAKPVLVTVANGVPSTRYVEFQMPCTKEEALQSAQ